MRHCYVLSHCLREQTRNYHNKYGKTVSRATVCDGEVEDVWRFLMFENRGYDTQKSILHWSNWSMTMKTATHFQGAVRSPCRSSTGSTIAPNAQPCQNSTTRRHTLCLTPCVDCLGKVMAYRGGGFFWRVYIVGHPCSVQQGASAGFGICCWHQPWPHPRPCDRNLDAAPNIWFQGVVESAQHKSVLYLSATCNTESVAGFHGQFLLDGVGGVWRLTPWVFGRNKGGLEAGSTDVPKSLRSL